MGGSGREDFFRDRKPEDVQKDLRKEEERTRDQAFDTKVAERLGQLTIAARERDAHRLAGALREVTQALSDYMESAQETTFGGAAQKLEQVDGFSDVDIVVILALRHLESNSPGAAYDLVIREVGRTMAGWEVDRRGSALKLTKDDFAIYILIGVQDRDISRVPQLGGNTWARFDAHRFLRKLTTANSQRGGKVAPVITLAKTINARQPEAWQLSGYHIEGIAIEAFKNYGGALNPKAMLEQLFEVARSLVLEPLRDDTGQAMQVDAYLGSARSIRRREVAASLDRIFRRMKNADSIRSEDQWLELFGQQ